MPIFNFFKVKNPLSESRLKSDIEKNFINQECRCVQQEFDLSELTWMDNSAYKNSKAVLRQSSGIAIRTYLAHNPQRDLFDISNKIDQS